MLVFS